MRRHTQRARESPLAKAARMVCISLFIAACLVVQAVASSGKRPGPFEYSPYQWPFIDYPMYSSAHYEGEEVSRLLLIGIRPDSTKIEIEPDDLGLTFFPYLRGPIRAVRDSSRSAASVFRDIFAERHGVEVVGFEVLDRPIMITRDGYHPGPPKTVASLSFDEPVAGNGRDQ